MAPPGGGADRTRRWKSVGAPDVPGRWPAGLHDTRGLLAPRTAVAACVIENHSTVWDVAVARVPPASCSRRSEPARRRPEVVVFAAIARLARLLPLARSAQARAGR